MNELLLALWAMTCTHPRWEMPPDPPAIVVQAPSTGGQGVGQTEVSQKDLPPARTS